MTGRGPRAITARSVLAVEGEDERKFFEALLRHINVIGVQIEPVGGKDQFRDKLPALLRTPGFYKADGSSFVEHLALVRDKNGDDAFESIANIVTKAGLIPPLRSGQFSEGSPRVGIFIMPGGNIAGTMLEDLCLEMVKDHPAMTCVRSFADCVQRLAGPPRSPSKAKCQIFLAAQGEIVNSVGLGAQKGHWNLDAPCLDELKRFLLTLK